MTERVYEREGGSCVCVSEERERERDRQRRRVNTR